METLIAGAVLYDGFGGPGRVADVTISCGRIGAVEVPGVIGRTGKWVVDAKGLSLAPGWVDSHSHSDENYFDTPGADSKISQGITTEICGNCGFSPDEKGDHGGLAAFAERLNRVVPAVNVATFTGFNSLRMQVMGDTGRPARAEEIARMCRIFEEELRLGSLGLSSGLYYVSGKFAPTEEVMALAKLLRGTGKPYAAHLRSEGEGLTESICEAVQIASAGSGSLQISHFKTMGRENFGKLGEALKLVEAARADGLRVHGDRYPYIYSSTGLRTILPPPFGDMEDAPMQAALKNPAQSALLREMWQKNCPDWAQVLVVDSDCPGHAPFLGKNMLEIAALAGVSPEDACIRLLSEALPRAAFGCMSDANLREILRQDWIFAGSDAGCRAFGNSKVHPRAFGTMPRFFRQARVAGVPAGEIIRRMTLAPAVKFQLKDRGAVKPGLAADLVLFDENGWDSQADYVHADRVTAGVHGVWVNGEPAYSPENGVSPRRAGRFLAV